MVLGPEAPRTALEDVAVVEKPIEHGGDGGSVAEEFSPILDGTVRGEEGAGALVTSHDELEKVFGGCGRELFHSEVVDDQERYGRQHLDVFLASAVERGVSEFFEQDVCLAVR